MTKKNPIRKIAKETKGEHELFLKFLEHRDIKKLSDDTGVAESALNMIKSKGDWEERAFAKEAELVGLHVKEAEIISTEEFLKSNMRDRHRVLCEQLEWVVDKGIKYYARYMNDLALSQKDDLPQPKRPPITLDSLTRCADQVIKLSRLTEGEASSITEVKKQVDYSKLSITDLKELKRLKDMAHQSKELPDIED